MSSPNKNDYLSKDHNSQLAGTNASQNTDAKVDESSNKKKDQKNRPDTEKKTEINNFLTLDKSNQSDSTNEHEQSYNDSNLEIKSISASNRDQLEDAERKMSELLENENLMQSLDVIRREFTKGDDNTIVVVEQKPNEVVPIKTYRFALTPYRMNRYLLLTIIVIYVVFIGTHFFNWTRWESILARNNAFKESCTDGTEGPCLAQRVEISGLLPITTSTMFAFTFLAGILLDTIGPKVCSLIGLSLLLIAWSLLLMPNPVGIVYKIGFALIGAGSDPSFFGTLSIANLFPGHSSTIISIFGAARSLSNFWPLLFDFISQKNPKFTFSVMALLFTIVNVICIAIVLLFIPRRSYVLTTTSPIRRDKNSMRTPMNASLLTSEAATGGLGTKKQSGSLLGSSLLTTGGAVNDNSIRKTPSMVSNYTFLEHDPSQLQQIRQATGLILLSEESISLEPYAAQPISSEVVYTSPSCLPPVGQSQFQSSFSTDRASFSQNLPFQATSDQQPIFALQVDQVSTKSPLVCCSTSITSKLSERSNENFNKKTQMPESNAAEKKKRYKRVFGSIKLQMIDLIKYLSDPQYIPIIILCTLNIVRNNYFLTTARDQLGVAESLLAILNTLAFIPGPICGFLVDRYSPLNVMIGINVFNTLLFITLFVSEFILINSVTRILLQYISVILAFPGIGYLLSQIYCYIAVNFPPENLGKLAGFASFVAGMVGLSVQAMKSYTEQAGKFWQMNLLNIFFSIIAFMCLGKLWFSSHKLKQEKLTEDFKRQQQLEVFI